VLEPLSSDLIALLRRTSGRCVRRTRKGNDRALGRRKTTRRVNVRLPTPPRPPTPGSAHSASRTHRVDSSCRCWFRTVVRRRSGRVVGVGRVRWWVGRGRRSRPSSVVSATRSSMRARRFPVAAPTWDLGATRGHPDPTRAAGRPAGPGRRVGRRGRRGAGAASTPRGRRARAGWAGCGRVGCRRAGPRRSAGRPSGVAVGEQRQIQISADGVEQPRMPGRCGRRRQRLDPRHHVGDLVQGQVQPREVRRARLGLAGPDPTLPQRGVVPVRRPLRVQRDRRWRWTQTPWSASVDLLAAGSRPVTMSLHVFRRPWWGQSSS